MWVEVSVPELSGMNDPSSHLFSKVKLDPSQFGGDLAVTRDSQVVES